MRPGLVLALRDEAGSHGFRPNPAPRNGTATEGKGGPKSAGFSPRSKSTVHRDPAVEYAVRGHGQHRVHGIGVDVDTPPFGQLLQQVAHPGAEEVVRQVQGLEV